VLRGDATRPGAGSCNIDATCPTSTGFDFRRSDAISDAMNAQLKHLLKVAESWPEADQEELIAYAREIEARRTGVYELSEDERAAIEEGIAQADRGEFATDEEVAALFRRYGA
jgi:predicted transcriptional regulator